MDEDDNSSRDDDEILALDGNSDLVISLPVDDASQHDVDESRDHSDICI